MKSSIPLAESMRPQSFQDIIGQNHLVGEQGFITHVIKQGNPLSIILWGPPGSGKTSLARLYAKAFSMPFVSISAVFSGISDLKRIIKGSEDRPLFEKKIMLFVDEIHRFNKTQQDAFLPFLENGTIVLVGATTENPSFYLNNALLSRVRVLTLHSLSENDLALILSKFEERIRALPLTPETRSYIIKMAQGDGRYLLNLIENIQGLNETLDPSSLQNFLQKRAALFDRGNEHHYNLISALHKSIRGSDPDAALYWFFRMLEGGEDPLFIARRLIRMASEDIGLADPQSLALTIAARDSYQMLGSPEGELALAEVVVYLALSPKSNALYLACHKAKEAASQTSHLPPPPHILNAPTRLMKELGYGKDYQYDHDTKKGFSGQNYFPEDLERQVFYEPVERGFEREMKKRVEYFKHLRSTNT